MIPNYDSLEKVTYNLYLHLPLLHQPHGHVTAIWVLGNWLTLWIVGSILWSPDHCNLFCWFPAKYAHWGICRICLWCLVICLTSTAKIVPKWVQLMDYMHCILFLKFSFFSFCSVCIKSIQTERYHSSFYLNFIFLQLSVLLFIFNHSVYVTKSPQPCFFCTVTHFILSLYLFNTNTILISSFILLHTHLKVSISVTFNLFAYFSWHANYFGFQYIDFHCIYHTCDKLFMFSANNRVVMLHSKLHARSHLYAIPLLMAPQSSFVHLSMYKQTIKRLSYIFIFHCDQCWTLH